MTITTPIDLFKLAELIEKKSSIQVHEMQAYEMILNLSKETSLKFKKKMEKKHKYFVNDFYYTSYHAKNFSQDFMRCMSEDELEYVTNKYVHTLIPPKILEVFHQADPDPVPVSLSADIDCDKRIEFTVQDIPLSAVRISKKSLGATRALVDCVIDKQIIPKLAERVVNDCQC